MAGCDSSRGSRCSSSRKAGMSVSPSWMTENRRPSRRCLEDPLAGVVRRHPPGIRKRSGRVRPGPEQRCSQLGEASSLLDRGVRDRIDVRERRPESACQLPPRPRRLAFLERGALDEAMDIAADITRLEALLFRDLVERIGQKESEPPLVRRRHGTSVAANPRLRLPSPGWPRLPGHARGRHVTTVLSSCPRYKSNRSSLHAHSPPLDARPSRSGYHLLTSVRRSSYTESSRS